MELYIYIEYLCDNHPHGVYCSGVKEYEQYKKWCAKHKRKIVESYICAYKPDEENIFAIGERIADTKEVDCAQIKIGRHEKIAEHNKLWNTTIVSCL